MVKISQIARQLSTPILLLTFCLILLSCESIENYDDPEEPLYTGSYVDTPPEEDGGIKVISWNIKFSEKIEEAIAELSTVEELQDADILLLQEMDEEGVEQIAKTLNYNYVYYPASIHSEHGKNFGNAILAKWPISHPRKLVLPHKNPTNDQIRIAVRGIVTIGDKEIVTYSVHTETIWLNPARRNEQIDALVADATEIDQAYTYGLSGGDFNTATPGSIGALTKRFEEVGYERMSEGLGYTVIKSGIKFVIDHIFAKKMSFIDGGVWRETEASDHFPVWVDLQLN